MRGVGPTLLLLASHAALGCATWDIPAATTELKLPLPNAGSNAIVYETAFIRWPAETPDSANSLWKGMDEQFLPVSLRQQLAANGLRVGILGDPLPDAIRESLAATSDLLSVITDQHATPGTEMLSRRERRTCPSGSTEEIEVLPMREGMKVVLIHEQGKVRAISLDQPRGFFQLTFDSVGDGSVRLEIIPTLDHGKLRPRIIGGQNAIFRYNSVRDREAFENLTMTPTLSPGQTLVISSVPENKGLGALLFGQRFEATTSQLLLLIRISEAGRLDLFTPQKTHAPLATPLPSG